MTLKLTSWCLTALVSATLLPAAVHAQGINARRANQHARIRQGVASGQLTRGEARGLRHREMRIHHSEMRDRMMNGGRLTAGERTHLNARLNRASGAIYRKKHNAAVR